MKKITTFAWTPFTGLGAYGGFRGNRWLRNRIKIYKQFVVASLQAQTDQNFIYWISWRPEEFQNRLVEDLSIWMKVKLGADRVVFTYGGLPMWDDKFPDDEASAKIMRSLKRTLPFLADAVGNSEEVRVLLVPSDDLYDRRTIETMNFGFNENPKLEAIGYHKGYICNYNTKEVLEYTPNTNPPFFMARFPAHVFLDPQKHYRYISMKRDEGKYKAGTPYASHEYIPNAFNMDFIGARGFMVGTHGENISTHFNHPFGGRQLYGKDREAILFTFGIDAVPKLALPFSLRKAIIRRLPYRWQRKLRYLLGEKLFQRFYNFIRN